MHIADLAGLVEIHENLAVVGMFVLHIKTVVAVSKLHIGYIDYSIADCTHCCILVDNLDIGR